MSVGWWKHISINVWTWWAQSLVQVDCACARLHNQYITHACNQNVLKSLRLQSRHLPLPTQPPFKPSLLNLFRTWPTQHTLRNKLLLTILLMTRRVIVDNRFRLREFKDLFWTTTLVLSVNWTKRPSVNELANIIHTGKEKLTHKMWPDEAWVIPAGSDRDSWRTYPSRYLIFTLRQCWG